ncbi:hypothetical protein [Phaeobacter sp. HF9A]|uniref:hypothetical protein n=1 Tax=Phaeobacter sp. HF9A TaxID=2721561 RepID=UPI001430FEAC|nr:hypothetical protein [Phaeobacter sp. HF9A]NIZ11996.1 hypothetical protein [Phaeobacter sp. HF9A]
MTTSLTSIAAAATSASPLSTSATDAAAPSSAAQQVPAFDFGVNVSGTAAALGLSQPRNVQDLELIFAQVAGELDATRSQTGDLSAAADLSKKASDIGLMGQGAADLNAMSPSIEEDDLLAKLVSFVVYLVNAVFGMISDTAQNSGAVTSTNSKTEQGIENAIGQSVKTEQNFFDRQMSRDIVSPDQIAAGMPENEGDPVEVAQRSSAFALALGVVASSLEQVLATAVPQNAGAMGPSSQEDGRVRLAV